MTTTHAPAIVHIEDLVSDFDPYLVEKSRQRADELTQALIPARYRTAQITKPEVATWVRGVVTGAVETSRGRPSIAAGVGPSLTLLGPTGTGKTHEACAALRALAVSGIGVNFQMTTAADLYARMRPRHGIDPETEFTRVAHAQVLVLDDLGAAKNSEWVEEINFRLVNHRYEHAKPTLFTSNVPTTQLKDHLGERVTSRLREMSTRAVLDGPDRRHAAA